MNIDDLSNGSESSDEDYVPQSNTNLPSEEESDGDVEEDEFNLHSKRQIKVSKPRKRQKSKSPSPITIEKPGDVKSTDDLWADFKKDTGFKTKAERKIATETVVCDNNLSDVSKNNCRETASKPNSVNLPKTIKVTETYTFAGEEIQVEKDVNIASSSKLPVKRGATSGISSVLNHIGKKGKISTLEKSKLDWDKFKKDEKIEDELNAYGKSKDGYLERQDFLQRADLRRFEIEKSIRSNLRSNRLNDC